MLDECIAEFNKLNESDEWINYAHYNEKKKGLNKLDLLPEAIKGTINELNSPEFLKFLSTLTGIKDLQKDDFLEGGGIHQSTKGRLSQYSCRFYRAPSSPELAAEGKCFGLPEQELAGGMGWQVRIMGQANESVRSKSITRF